MSSSQSLCIELNSFSDRYRLSFRSISQYSVSLASFKAMFILFRKSAFDCACSASLINAPIAVPLLTVCFDKVNSLFSVVKNLYNSIHLNTNAYDFGPTTLFMIYIIEKNKSNNYMEITLHSQLSIKQDETYRKRITIDQGRSEPNVEVSSFPA